MKKAILIGLAGAAAAALILAACASAPAPGIPGLPTATGAFTPGTHIVTVGEAGTPMWRSGPMVVEVEFGADQIRRIEVISHGDSRYGSNWFYRAHPGVQDQILVRQSTLDIDAFTGATNTRNSVIEAVNQAIVLAGANPADLQPQFITAPLPGDLFIPGFVEITVPHGTYDRLGNPMAADTPLTQRMLYGGADMTLRVSFGRNELHIHNGGAAGVGQGAAGHGESFFAITPALSLEAASAALVGPTGGGTWGGWFFRQTVLQQINDRQSTVGVEIAGQVDGIAGATMSASAIRWGAEQAIIIAQGDNPQALTPREDFVQAIRPYDAPNSAFFRPGSYLVTVDGRNGPMEVYVVLDRTLIRRVVVTAAMHSETPAYWERAWLPTRDRILHAQWAGLDALDGVDIAAGATLSSNAIIEAVRQAGRLAWID
jgi:uncharacterized protein with FMN-binding domain